MHVSRFHVFARVVRYDLMVKSRCKTATHPSGGLLSIFNIKNLLTFACYKCLFHPRTSLGMQVPKELGPRKSRTVSRAQDANLAIRWLLEMDEDSPNEAAYKWDNPSGVVDRGCPASPLLCRVDFNFCTSQKTCTS